MDTKRWGIRLLLVGVLFGVTACQAALPATRPAPAEPVAAVETTPVAATVGAPGEGRRGGQRRGRDGDV
ncbi:MAG: hypothetical protein IPK16_11530 [Anaerolineales bacterium]|nr:hypothetical protein [Anaerolineales bacterium]